jgi:hypothetical protein
MNFLTFNLYGCPAVGVFTHQILLASDFDRDGDVDGSDLSTLANDPTLLGLEEFSSDFGYCLSCQLP